MKSNLFLKKSTTNICVIWDRVEGKLKMQILLLSQFFLLLCNREIYVSAAMATKGKNGLKQDIRLQKISVLAAVTPVHREDLGPESCQVWLLTQWIMYHCSSMCPCQSLTHSAVKSRDLILTHYQEA